MLDQPRPDSSSAEALAPTADAPPASVEPSWSARVELLLLEAAALCVDHDVDPEAFMQAAWSACLDTRPGLREHIADMQLMGQVENLRSRGQVGEA